MTSPVVKASADNSIADAFANMDALYENTGFDANFLDVVLLASWGLVVFAGIFLYLLNRHKYVPRDKAWKAFGIFCAVVVGYAVVIALLVPTVRYGSPEQKAYEDSIDTAQKTIAQDIDTHYTIESIALDTNDVQELKKNHAVYGVKVLVDKETEASWDVIYDESDDRIYLRTNAKERVVPGDVAK